MKNNLLSNIQKKEGSIAAQVSKSKYGFFTLPYQDYWRLRREGSLPSRSSKLQHNIAFKIQQRNEKAGDNPLPCPAATLLQPRACLVFGAASAWGWLVLSFPLQNQVNLFPLGKTTKAKHQRTTVIRRKKAKEYLHKTCFSVFKKAELKQYGDRDITTYTLHMH